MSSSSAALGLPRLRRARYQRSVLKATARQFSQHAKRLVRMEPAAIAGVVAAWVSTWASALLTAAVDATEPPNLLPTMKDVAFWNAAAATTPSADASSLEQRAARIVDTAVTWALAPVFYCCVLVDSLQLRCPSPEIVSSAVVSIMLGVFVATTAVAAKCAALAAELRCRVRHWFGDKPAKVSPSAAEDEVGAAIRS